MSLALWIVAAGMLWLLGAVGFTRGLMRGGAWFFLGCLGSGLCCLFLGMLGRAAPPLGHPVWGRLLWTTLLLSMPAWVGFSYRFGRERVGARWSPAVAIPLGLWAISCVLLALGSKNPPLEIAGRGELLLIRPPVGRLVVLDVLLGMVLVLWNLQATLEAARAASRRRTALAVYALVPVTITAIYVTAEALLYREQTANMIRLLLLATLLSAIGFGAVLIRRKLGEIEPPAGGAIVYSSAVLTTLGLLLVALAAISQILRAIGVVRMNGWGEPVTAACILAGLALAILPGLREELRRFVDRRLLSSRFDDRETWTRIDGALASPLRRDEIGNALQEALRQTFGPIRLQVWAGSCEEGEYAPLAGRGAPPLSAAHPLIAALRGRRDPLIVTGEAGAVSEIPLHLACDELRRLYGLRIFIPVRSGERLIGVMACGSSEGRTLHPEDIALLERLAARVASVLDATASTRAGGALGWSAAAPSVARGEEGR